MQGHYQNYPSMQQGEYQNPQQWQTQPSTQSYHHAGAMHNMVPGQAKMVPGQANMVPGQANMVPGQANMVPGQANMVPGQANIGSDSQNLCGEAEGVRYRILYRDVNSIVECQLQANARINIAAGSMAAMSANLKLEGKVKLKNMFSGGKTFSSCVTAPNGPGELILAPPMMADVMPLQLSGGVEWIVGESCFLGSTPGVQKATKTQGLGKTLLSGEGLFVTKLSGNGVAFITSLGAIHCIQLQHGQEYVIDNEHLVAWSATMTYKIELIGSFMTSLVSSEGSICRFSGPGTVYMQTRNPGALAAYMRSIGVGKA